MPEEEASAASTGDVPTAPSAEAPAAEAAAEAATASKSGDAPVSRTQFGVMVGLLQMARVSADGAVPDTPVDDVLMDEFFQAAEAYRLALSVMGTATSVATGDIGKNLIGAKEAFDKESDKRRTLRSFLQAELDLGIHKSGPSPSLKDPSGACQLQWLLRGFEFFLTVLKLLFQGDTSAPSIAYGQTLAKYHGWVTRAGVKTALLGIPSKDSVCKNQALCPTETDKHKLAEVITNDITIASAEALPLILRMIAIFQEMNLYEKGTV